MFLLFKLVRFHLYSSSEFENERKAEMFDVVNDNNNILDADEQVNFYV